MSYPIEPFPWQRKKRSALKALDGSLHSFKNFTLEGCMQ
ncbi:hypothetical protein LEP1GSC058_0607 [Leptospira fainei serovar Hurstbridge str. BUT 6]|uniref:Uncharacterized protein n=1 Tax=Leptospira fainei serovar Hurstbridge str. BUT 6 TaxID=1193011 RepID=S3V5D6_9LEPT|nr:hypothetical protein LEP1GSC058_0607 [Leptospira fainei serovar Hurstbridge str. BUT 6]